MPRPKGSKNKTNMTVASERKYQYAVIEKADYFKRKEYYEGHCKIVAEDKVYISTLFDVKEIEVFVLQEDVTPTRVKVEGEILVEASELNKIKQLGGIGLSGAKQLKFKMKVLGNTRRKM